MTFAIRASALTKRYPGKPPVDAVRGIDLEVRRGECFGLLGPNGAGKTTTMEMLEGLLEPTSGNIEVLEFRWDTHEHAIRSKIGISLQATRLEEKLTVLETVRLFRSFYREGIPPEEAVATVSLQEKSNSRLDKLSGGQLQRLAIATAIVGAPEVLFLDEPTTGLDPQSRRQLWDIIRSYQSQGRTIVLTTHYMDEAEKLCERVAVIDHGKIIALGTPLELIRQYGGDHIVQLRIPGQSQAALVEFQHLPSIQQARYSDEDGFTLIVEHPHIAIPAIIQHCQQRSLELAHLSTRTGTLEDVFLHLTGRHLRDTPSDALAT